MKESQGRTKVVLRHLPPSISEAALLEHVDGKFAGCYTWFSFRPGKASIKRQVLSRAYINFKKAEDVYDFYEDFDGHVFVNEKGTQYKVTVEYAPYQRTPKPRSKKDIREGTITKDSDYLEFLEMLGKPMEFLPSAEVQLERREAEKAAALGAGGGKDSVVVTPLMEFVRQRRAAKSGTQRSMASKLGPRSGGVTVVTSNLASHKRGLERSRSGTLMYVPEIALSGLSSQKDFKEVAVRDSLSAQRRDELQQRKIDRETIIEKRKKEMTEVKERKLVHEPVPITVASSKGNSATQMETSKENMNVAVSVKESLVTVGDLKVDDMEGVDVDLSGSHVVAGKALVTTTVSGEGVVGDVSKDVSKREVVKRKQLTVVKEKLHKDFEGGPSSPGQVSGGGYNMYNQRHRPPVSPRVGPASAQLQVAPSSHAPSSGEVGTGVAVSKLNHRREFLGKNSSKGALSSRDQQSPSHQLTTSNLLHLEQVRSQQGSPQSDRGGKRPPRPQNVRLVGKEATPSDSEVGVVSSPLVAEEKLSKASVTESFSGSDRQDARRVRNKDRPDRPVWTPRRRSDTTQSVDPSSAASTSTAQASDLGDSNLKAEKIERGHHRAAGKGASILGQNSVENLGSGLPSDGGRSQSGAGSMLANNSSSGKTRYVESSHSRSARGARAGAGNVASTQEHSVHHGEQRSDSSLPPAIVDSKTPHAGLYNTRENGDIHISMADKEKHKQDSAPVWNELTGGSHRRRERGTQHGSKDTDGVVANIEPSKPVKRGGNLAVGGNEKQVWVAVQKSASGT